MSVTIRTAAASDAAQLVPIYNHYIAATCVTFETEPVLSKAWHSACKRPSMRRCHGWLWKRAARSPATPMHQNGKAGVRIALPSKSTIYLDPERTGRGLGIELYTALIEAIKVASMRSVIGGIALPNDASIRLHERLGFKKVGHFEKVGFKHDRWVDVGYWQLQLALPSC